MRILLRTGSGVGSPRDRARPACPHRGPLGGGRVRHRRCAYRYRQRARGGLETAVRRVLEAAGNAPGRAVPALHRGRLPAPRRWPGPLRRRRRLPRLPGHRAALGRPGRPAGPRDGLRARQRQGPLLRHPPARPRRQGLPYLGGLRPPAAREWTTDGGGVGQPQHGGRAGVGRAARPVRRRGRRSRGRAPGTGWQARPGAVPGGGQAARGGAGPGGGRGGCPGRGGGGPARPVRGGGGCGPGRPGRRPGRARRRCGRRRPWASWRWKALPSGGMAHERLGAGLRRLRPAGRAAPGGAVHPRQRLLRHPRGRARGGRRCRPLPGHLRRRLLQPPGQPGRRP